MKMTAEDRNVWDYFACNALTSLIERGVAFHLAAKDAAMSANMLMEERAKIEIIPTPGVGMMRKEFSELSKSYHPLLKSLVKAEREVFSGECLLPPAGWACSRGKGHDGPCAAYEKHDYVPIKGECDGSAEVPIPQGEGGGVPPEGGQG